MTLTARLSPILAPARAAWSERTAREQALLAGLAVLVAALGLWFFALQPALAARADARAEFERAVSDHRAFSTELARYRVLAASLEDRAETRRPLRTLAGEYARRRDLAITRVLPDETGRLNVWVDNVTDAALFGWLADLAENEGIVAERASLDREGDGVVRAQVLLARGGAA